VRETTSSVPPPFPPQHATGLFVPSSESWWEVCGVESEAELRLYNEQFHLNRRPRRHRVTPSGPHAVPDCRLVEELATLKEPRWKPSSQPSPPSPSAGMRVVSRGGEGWYKNSNNNLPIFPQPKPNVIWDVCCCLPVTEWDWNIVH